jgi:hypothetical protein
MPTAGVNQDVPQAARVWFPGIEVGRLAAALGVVWIHMCDLLPESAGRPAKAAVEFSVPFFTAASVGLLFLQASRSKQGNALPFSSVVLARAKRILLPFAVASLIYGGLDHLKALLQQRPAPELTWAHLLLGTHTAYWFLPFLFVVTTLLWPLATWLVTRKRESLAAAGVLLAASVGIALTQSPLEALGFHGFVALAWWENLPGVGIGAAWALLRLTKRFDAPISLRWSVILVALACAIQTLIFFFPDARAARHVTAAVLLVAATLAPRAWLERAAAFGGYAFFIYVVHPFLLWPAYAVLKRAGEPSLLMLGAASVGVFLCALALGVALKRSAKTRWLVP